MSTLTSYTVDFRQRDADGNPVPGTVDSDRVPYWRVLVCPPQVEVGDPFRVTVLAPFPASMEWPYSTPTGPDSATAETFTETINITGRTEIEMSYPAASLGTVTAVNEIVNEDLSIVFAAASSVSGAHIVAGRVVLPAAWWGTLSITYTGHAPAFWDFDAESHPEEYLLRVDAAVLPEPEDVIISIRDPGAPAAGDACTGHGWSL